MQLKLLRILFTFSFVLCLLSSVTALDMLANQSPTVSSQTKKAVNLFATASFTLTFAYGTLSSVLSPNIRKFCLTTLAEFTN